MMSSLRVLLAAAFALQAASAFAQHPPPTRNARHAPCTAARSKAISKAIQPSPGGRICRPVTPRTRGATVLAPSRLRPPRRPTSILAISGPSIAPLPPRRCRRRPGAFTRNLQQHVLRTRRPSELGDVHRQGSATLSTQPLMRARVAVRPSIGGYGTIHRHAPAAFAALCDELVLPDERSRRARRRARAARRRSRTRRGDATRWRSRTRRRAWSRRGPRRRDGQRTVGSSGGLGAEHEHPAVLRSSDEGRRDPAAHRRKVDRELTAGDGRSACARPQVDARDRARRRQPGSFRRHQHPACRIADTPRHARTFEV